MTMTRRAAPSACSLTQRVLGASMLAHFLLVLAIKIASGVPGEILWMSHIGLALAGLGLLLDRAFLVAIALLDVLVLHLLWLADCAGWWATGVFPLGITTYLSTADFWVWVGTAHHFYLVPVLIVFVDRAVVRTREALLGAVIVYLFLTVICRAVTLAALNVNFAFGARVGLSVPFFEWGNRQDGSLYMLGLNAFVFVFMILPAYLFARVGRPVDARLNGTGAASPRAANLERLT